MDFNHHLDFRRANDSEVPHSTLERLAAHSDPLVRGAVAMNMNTSFELWSRLLEDANEHVRECACLRASPRTPE